MKKNKYDSTLALTMLYGSDDHTNCQELDLQQERAKLAEKQRRKLELQIAEMEGRLIPAEDVEQRWSKLAFACRAKLLSIPTRLAPEIVNCKNLAQAQAMLTDLVHEALTELSQGKNSGGE
jgi:phage terminase Nu1 subunit (DNA packaging protein)